MPLRRALLPAALATVLSTVLIAPTAAQPRPARLAPDATPRAETWPPLRNVPTKKTADALLAGITTDNNAPNVPDYDRKKFQETDTAAWKTWPPENCTTRDKTLVYYGKNIKHTNKKNPCEVTSGRWGNPYGGPDAKISYTKDADVDHIVPLKNAWQSGAKEWTKQKRVTFANDMTEPQLLVVHKKDNTAKGAKGPEAWKPHISYQCTYAKAWVRVKSHYTLTVTTAERTALEGMLNAKTCT
ncbi:HNH endonuclease family protein [Streptomyces sp. NPDC039022]|uniref:HNH endonuclease family protein n=1 Tax=Streptomyces sp. NPDC039022 TaxID=3157091 RepID=UPI0033E9CF0B